MIEYIIKRILLMVPTLIGMITVTFLVIQFVPGGPAEQMLYQITHQNSAGPSEAGGSLDYSERSNRKELEKEQLEYLRTLYDFDKPLHERYFRWITRLFTFNFGESYYHNETVTGLIKQKLPVSMSLGISSFFIVYMVCIPLGIKKAIRNGTAFDNISSMIVLVGYSIPGFVLGVALLVLFGGGTFWNIFPLRGLTSDNFNLLPWYKQILDYLWHLTLPLLCFIIGSFSVLTMLTKNSILDELDKQYVMTAKAKGLTQKAVLYKHVLKNALIPIITGFPSGFLTMFFTGSLLIETLFSLDGLGLLSYESVIRRDYPVVMGSLFFFSLLYLIGNLLSDLAYVLIDPRISFEKMKH